jgi:hypothetical protein
VVVVKFSALTPRPTVRYEPGVAPVASTTIAPTGADVRTEEKAEAVVIVDGMFDAVLLGDEVVENSEEDNKGVVDTDVKTVVEVLLSGVDFHKLTPEEVGEELLSSTLVDEERSGEDVVKVVLSNLEVNEVLLSVVSIAKLVEVTIG